MGPPEALVRSLVPAVLSDLEWHQEVSSTNVMAGEAARRGAPEVHAVLADRQTAGRGRLGRSWQAPGGTSLLLSLLVRPEVPAPRLSLLPLLAGVALAEAVEPFCSGATVGLKWPNDLLVGGRKAAGILGEGLGGAVVIGIGCNVDWRAVERHPELAGATSLAEAVGGTVDRWRVLAALVGVFGNRYRAWKAEPGAFLDDYQARSATLGRQVRITRHSAPAVEGLACAIGPDGSLVVRTPDGATVRCSAGDVEHLRPL